jgi:hypothetical protein
VQYVAGGAAGVGDGHRHPVSAGRHDPHGAGLLNSIADDIFHFVVEPVLTD